MDERLRFLARVLDGEPMTEVCRDFGISRKTGEVVLPLGDGELPGPVQRRHR